MAKFEILRISTRNYHSVFKSIKIETDPVLVTSV